VNQRQGLVCALLAVGLCALLDRQAVRPGRAQDAGAVDSGTGTTVSIASATAAGIFLRDGPGTIAFSSSCARCDRPFTASSFPVWVHDPEGEPRGVYRVVFQGCHACLVETLEEWRAITGRALVPEKKKRR